MKKNFILFFIILSFSLFAWGDYDKNGWHKKTGVNKETGTLFNTQGYSKDGYNEGGYDREGYDKSGYNSKGFNRLGEHKKGFMDFYLKGYTGLARMYDEDGYNKDGYNFSGYNRNGYNIKGYNAEGYNAEGYNQEGYNNERYNIEGYDRNGWTKEGININTKTKYNDDGFDKYGFNNLGINKDTKTKYDIYGFDVNRTVPKEFFKNIKNSDISDIEKEVMNFIKNPIISKNQFETTNQFEERKNQKIKENDEIYINLKNKVYYYKFDDKAKCSYDADKEQWELIIPKSIVVKDGITDMWKKKFRMSNGIEVSANVVFSVKESINSNKEYKVNIPMDIEKAKKANLEFILIYKMSNFDEKSINKKNTDFYSTDSKPDHYSLSEISLDVLYSAIIVGDKGSLIYSDFF